MCKLFFVDYSNNEYILSVKQSSSETKFCFRPLMAHFFYNLRRIMPSTKTRKSALVLCNLTDKKVASLRAI